MNSETPALMSQRPADFPTGFGFSATAQWCAAGREPGGCGLACLVVPEPSSALAMLAGSIRALIVGAYLLQAALRASKRRRNAVLAASRDVRAVRFLRLMSSPLRLSQRGR